LIHNQPTNIGGRNDAKKKKKKKHTHTHTHNASNKKLRYDRDFFLFVATTDSFASSADGVNSARLPVAGVRLTSMLDDFG
jgi:predicted ATPase